MDTHSTSDSEILQVLALSSFDPAATLQATSSDEDSGLSDVEEDLPHSQPPPTSSLSMQTPSVFEPPSLPPSEFGPERPSAIPARKHAHNCHMSHVTRRNHAHNNLLTLFHRSKFSPRCLRDMGSWWPIKTILDAFGLPHSKNAWIGLLSETLKTEKETKEILLSKGYNYVSIEGNVNRYGFISLKWVLLMVF